MKEIAIENGLPMRFTWRGRVHIVSGIANTWRIDDGWWQKRVWQDRYKLITTTGLLVILTHDLIADEWHVIREYD